MANKKKPKQGEITPSQVVSYVYGGTTSRASYAQTGSYVQLRAVRKDPSVSLARALLVAAIQAGSWNIEADDDVGDDAREFVEHILKLRDSFISNCVAYGRVDYGWIAFEKVFDIKDGRIVISSLKPLLHDISTILVTPQGHFNGIRQNPLSGMPLDIGPEKCLHVAFDVEAGNLYGYPLLENIRESFDSSVECDAGAKEYDKKIAGAQALIRHPAGSATIDGETMTNAEIALLVRDGLQAGHGVCFPQSSVENVQEITDPAQAALFMWDISLLEAKGSAHADYLNRLNYLDKLKVRGLLMPERAILEGQFGTKAEAGKHGDMFVLNAERVDKEIITAINEQLVNQLVWLNYGPEMVGKIRVVAQPLVDAQREFLEKIYESINDPDLDIDTMRNKLDLPTLEGGSDGKHKAAGALPTASPAAKPVEDKPVVEEK